MKLPMVIFPFCPQNPVMEETVWEQYTVTLQRVSPICTKAYQTLSQYLHFSHERAGCYTQSFTGNAFKLLV